MAKSISLKVHIQCPFFADRTARSMIGYNWHTNVVNDTSYTKTV